MILVSFQFHIMVLAVLWLLLGFLECSLADSIPGIVSRHNVGTVFKSSHVPIVFNTDHIDMTLAIPYTLSPPVSRYRNRTALFVALLDKHTKVMANRGSLIYFVECLEHTIVDLHDRADSLFKEISSMLASPWQDSAARRKRSRVQFLGDVGWSFFGIATGRQIDKLVQHIRLIDLALNEKDSSFQDRDTLVNRLASKQLQINRSLTDKQPEMTCSCEV